MHGAYNDKLIGLNVIYFRTYLNLYFAAIKLLVFVIIYVQVLFRFKQCDPLLLLLCLSKGKIKYIWHIKELLCSHTQFTVIRNSL
jgi:hypothetical protein